jgi:hypothetical protein
LNDPIKDDSGYNKPKVKGDDTIDREFWEARKRNGVKSANK